jgi:hypothetical protein
VLQYPGASVLVPPLEGSIILGQADAVAAGLTDHVWMLEELIKKVVVPHLNYTKVGTI